MATVSVNVPPEICPEVPAFTLWSELVEQQQRGEVDQQYCVSYNANCVSSVVPASSRNSGFNVNDPVWPVNQDSVTARGRLLSAYYGTVPIDMGHATAGSPDDELSQDHAEVLTNDARNTVQTERYGPKSFIQKFLRGKYSTIEVKTLATNWSLEAIVCQFAVPGEDQAARDIRNANCEVYLQGVQDLEQLWEREYAHAFKSAVKSAADAKGLNKKRLERAREHYLAMKGAPPVFDIDPPNGGQYWVSARECQQEKLVPFMNRAKVDRLRAYEGYFTKYMVASHYNTIMNIVDIRRLGENSNIHGIPQFWSMILNQWTNTCDLVLRHITDPQLGIRRELLMIDPSLRAAAYHNWSDRSLECF
ncbi:hypothetical protein J4E83_002585 [Alternaria metachromatica]|uniref:uncharacterized protein n=1 Tax=Alternaria metachromatica TaxID=283354 RepID=UPI0020C3CA9D|nr:uncharacterized protein J4E83_002585 [Alternaria metachromatica]KAI4631057.1 hypothetical protein J4E83_002585 [Alternaria metachromatica]